MGPTYGFRWNPFTFCGRISLVNVSSVNVPLSNTARSNESGVFRASFPCMFGTQVPLCLLRKSFNSVPDVDPRKLFYVVALARGLPRSVPGLAFLGVVATGPVQISSRAIVP